MKKTIKIMVVVILIILVGLLGFFAYKKVTITLPEDNLTKVNNLYKYNIFDKNEEILISNVNDNNLFYISNDKLFEDNAKITCKITKFNLLKNKKENSYSFDCTDYYISNLLIKDKKIIVVAENRDIGLELDYDLKLIKEYKTETKDYMMDVDLVYFGIYNGKKIKIKNRDIYIDKSLYDVIDKECGSYSRIMYGKNNYVYFADYSNNLSCLFNLETKEVTHLLSNDIRAFDNGYYYTIYNNNIINKKEGIYESELTLENGNELNNYNTSDDGRLIVSNNGYSKINVYDSKSQTLNYSVEFEDDNENAFISEVFIDGYVYFMRYEENTYNYYVWDYSKSDNINKKMVAINNIDYKFDNIKLINKLNEEYNIKIYAYDDSVRYFNDFYALPSNNDYQINTKLSELEETLKHFNKEFFTKFKFGKNKGLKIYLTNKVAPSNLATQISNPIGYSTKLDKDYVIAVNINDGSFKVTMCHEIMHSTETNMYDMYYAGKLTKEPFNKWNSYNPVGFDYIYSYVDEYPTGNTVGSDDTAYFVDDYAKTYPTEDKARVFENFCSTDDITIFKDNIYIKKKAEYLRDSIIKAYPSMQDSDLFDSLK